MTAAPRNIRARRDEGELEIEWQDGRVDRLPFRFLRGRCPCAGCVDEFTGVRRVDVDAVPVGVQPSGVSFTGNYALRIDWNDSHNTGLYTWEYLERLGRDAAAT
ncbi:MAG: DUF971 domain-containing protein [Planctomycetes bacterium]|nr:DUF971 domain-containing protein [Planctomycetota bacterium]